jgi:putative heme-binding domain-containing protein
MKKTFFTLASLLISQGNTFAQRNLTEIPSTDPAVEMASFKLADGMEINLFAAEPMVQKPIQMAWDAKGRLWVASSAIYPHIKPGQTESDKIIILEDTDNDGKADKSTTFFEGLLIPTGIWPQDGGVYVANSTELLFLSDTDGDGKADTRKVLLSGFGTEDTHHILHGIKGGPDGNIYFNQSVYIHSHIETPFGVRRLMGSGIWQYSPTTGRLEVFTMGQINPWGHIFDQWGQSFTTDGAYGEGINYVFPGATFRCLPDQLPRILKGLNPGQPKQCGLEIISGRHFPDDWQGNLITCDFRGHRVNRFAIKENGSGYSSQQMPDLISSNHGSFRPIDVNMGPDGAFYLADWFNPIIQHGEVDFRDPRRDHSNGRIWRISAKGREKSPRVDLTKLNETDLLEQLKAPEQALRYWTKQEIKSRKIDNLTGKLSAFLKKNPSPQLKAECMWTAQTAGIENFQWYFSEFWLDGKNGTINEPHMRAALVRLLRQLIIQQGLSAITDENGKVLSTEKTEAFFLQLCADENRRVRLEAINLLRSVASPRAIEIASTVLNQPMDENLDFALWRGCYELSSLWLPAFQRGEIRFANNSKGLLFALKAANQADAAGLLFDTIDKNEINETQINELLEIIGTTVDKKNINRLLSFAENKQRSASSRAAALAALAVAFQQQKIRPAQTTSITEMIADPSLPVSIAAIKLSGLWKIEEARARLEEKARGNDATTSAALSGIAQLGGDASNQFLAGIYSAPSDANKKAQILLAMTELDINASTPQVVAYLSSASEANAATASLIQAYLSRNNGPALLATALAGKKLKAEIASQALQKTSASGGDTKALIDALTTTGGLTPVTALDEAQMKQLISEVQQSGNAARGESIYRRQSMQCAVCHAIGPVGGIVGPNLVSIGSSAPMDYIVDSLLEPAKKIKEGYATVMVQTADGASHTGFLSREDAKEIVIRDAAGQLQTLPVSSITKKEIIPISLMPAGLTSALRRDELIDLVRFLSELGKDGQYKVQEDGTMRKWYSSETLATTNTIYTMVSGEIPLDEITPSTISGQQKVVIFSYFDVSQEGPTTLAFSQADNTRIEIDDKEITPVGGKITQVLSKGKHKVTLTISMPSKASTKKVQIISSNAKAVHEP